MTLRAAALFLFSTVAFLSQTPPKLIQPDPAIKCDSCAEWNQPRQPFKVFGNTYYVGVAGVSAV